VIEPHAASIHDLDFLVQGPGQMPIRIPPESSWCRLYLILLQDSTPQLKQGASIMEVERRTRVQSFHFRERYLGDSQKISYVLPGAELRQSLDTLVSFRFVAVSHS
jgi:hypothetical protein